VDWLAFGVGIFIGILLGIGLLSAIALVYGKEDK
jgi:hypothetical protein